MSRAALTGLLLGMLAGLAEPSWGNDPHLDPSLLQERCAACHRGHGSPRSPMLPGPQRGLCLSCHDNLAGLDQEVMRGSVAGGARPELLSSVYSKPYVHEVSDQAFSRRQPDAVTCTSCHSPHRAMPAGVSAPPGQRKLAPNNPNRFEFELCLSCHGDSNAIGEGADIGRLLNPVNHSYHPVEAPAAESSPSVDPALAGREINCTDCHNNNSSGPRGPHGSSFPYILRAGYATNDGNPESAAVYDLCYSCHDRTVVLEGGAFPEHTAHIVDERTSCATCHDAHGSVNNRALIRFDKATRLGVVAPSVSTGVLAFESTAPGSGTCYLTCHGRDHAPETYGLEDEGTLKLDRLLLQLPGPATPNLRPPGAREKPRGRRPRQKQR